MISFKSTTLPKPKFEHGVIVPGFGTIQHRRYNRTMGWIYDCLGLVTDDDGNKHSHFFWDTEEGIARRLNK